MLVLIENSLPDTELPAGLRLQNEYENIGLCLSADTSAPVNLYFIENLDVKYGVKAKLYSVQRGTTGIVRITKKQQEQQPLEPGLCVHMTSFSRRQKNQFRNGKYIPITGETELWMTKYEVEYRERA